MTAFLCPLLIGRAAETAMLRDLVAAARAGGGSAHAIVGDAGLGKSRLVRTAMESARRAGAVTALGRCVQGPVAAPLRPLSEAVSTLIRTGPTPQSAALAPYIPVLGRLARDLLPPGVDTAVSDPDAVHLGEGLLRLMRFYAGGGGALLVVEDLHAADALTLAVIEHLADALAAPAHELGLSLLLTLRAQPSPGADLVAALRRRRSLQSTVLTRLADGEVAELVRACAAGLPEPVVQVVVDRADGIPFLAEELLAAAADDLGRIDLVRVADVVPLSLADAVRRRCAALTPPVRELLVLAALAGRTTDPALLAAATGTGADEVVVALEPARAAQLLAEGEPCTFRHALTREALLAGVLPAQRVPLARRLLLASAAAGADGAVVAELAEAAGDDDAAARAWLRVADHAITCGLPEGAAAALERAGTKAAAAHDPRLRADVAHRRLAALALAGRADDVLRLSGQLQTSTHLDGEALQQLHLHAARAALDAGLHDRAERELAACDHADPQVLSLGALVALADGRLQEAQRRAHAVLDLAEPAATATCEAWEVLGRLRRPHDLPGAAAAFAAAHDAARAAGLALWEVRALHELGTVEMFLWRRTGTGRRAGSTSSPASSPARRGCRPHPRTRCGCWSARSSRRRGRRRPEPTPTRRAWPPRRTTRSSWRVRTRWSSAGGAARVTPKRAFVTRRAPFRQWPPHRQCSGSRH